MRPATRSLSRALPVVLAAAGMALAGCGRMPRKPPAERVVLSIYLPCVISAPMRKVVAAYETTHPEAEIWTETDKPLALPDRVQAPHDRPAAVITMGQIEMQSLVRAGLVASEDVRDIAVNTYPLVVVAPAEGAAGLHRLADLGGPRVEHIYLEDPAQSTLGDRAKRAFEKLGLWEKIAPKLVQFDPRVNVVSQLVDGKADAAVVFKECLFAERASPPKTIRLVGELPADAYPAIIYQAAAVQTSPQPDVPRQFVDFLASPGGREALQRAGLAAAEQHSK